MHIEIINVLEEIEIEEIYDTGIEHIQPNISQKRLRVSATPPEINPPKRKQQKIKDSFQASKDKKLQGDKLISRFFLWL